LSCFLGKIVAVFVKAVVEFAFAELVEASKRPQEKANEAGGFDRLSHRELPIFGN